MTGTAVGEAGRQADSNLEHNEVADGNSHLDASEFQCSVCFELLLDPVVGSCGHDFCMHCISAWKDERQRFGRSIQCPVCRAELLGSPFQSFGVCIRLRETIEKLFPDQLAARKRDVEQAKAVAAAHAAALNASSQFGASHADAELQASFTTYADAYRQLSQNLLSLIARHQAAAMGHHFQQQYQQLQQLQTMHSASIRANLQGSLQLLLRPPANPTSSTTSSTSTVTELSNQHPTTPLAAAAGGDDAMQVDVPAQSASTDGAAGASVDAALPQQHIHMQPPAAPPLLDQSASMAAFMLHIAQLQQQHQAHQQQPGFTADQQAATLYQQQAEAITQWYASMLAHQQPTQQQPAAVAAGVAGSGVAWGGSSIPPAGLAGATPPGMPRAVLNSWMVPAALTSEADLMRLYASLQSRIQTCERLLCMSGHGDMVAARQAAEVQHATAALAATAGLSAPQVGLPPYMAYIQQLQQAQQQQLQQHGLAASTPAWQAPDGSTFSGSLHQVSSSPRYSAAQQVMQERLMVQRHLQHHQQQQQQAAQQLWWQRQQQQHASVGQQPTAEQLLASAAAQQQLFSNAQQ